MAGSMHRIAILAILVLGLALAAIAARTASLAAAGGARIVVADGGQIGELGLYDGGQPGTHDNASDSSSSG
jgi:hypothetical protein